MNTADKERNLRIAEAMCRDLQWQGRIFREGQFVALFDGEIVAVADNPDDAIAALRALDPNPQHGMVIPIGPSTVDVIRGGGSRGSPKRWEDLNCVRLAATTRREGLDGEWELGLDREREGYVFRFPSIQTRFDSVCRGAF